METLPDLDQGPEVFETSDVESEYKLHLETEESGGLDIDSSRLDPKSAQGAFEENMLVGLLDLVDFLGSLLAEKDGSGYHTRKWTETKGQRLARIAVELAEIQGEDDQEREEVERLRKILDSLIEDRGQNGHYFKQVNTCFQQVEDQLALLEFSESTENKDFQKKTLISEKSGSKDWILGLVIELELRLNGLEQAIGLSEDTQGASLKLHLRDLDRKVNVLYNPEYEMDAMKLKVTELNKELEVLAKSRRMAQLALPETARAPFPARDPEASSSSVFEKKVESIYLKLGEMESARTQLPAVITRLKSLHQTHCDLAGAVTSIGELDNTLDTLEKDLLSWNANLDTVRTAIGKHVSTFDKKQQEIEKKLQHMETRVDGLLESD